MLLCWAERDEVGTALWSHVRVIVGDGGPLARPQGCVSQGGLTQHHMVT